MPNIRDSQDKVMQGPAIQSVRKKMATPKVMKLIDPYTGVMQCKVCGSEHRSDIKPRSGGKYHYGSWQCIYKCKLPDKVTS